MRRLSGFVRFWYDFIVGDDWTIAVGVSIALGLTYVLAHAGAPAWWLVPATVAVGLAVSLWRTTRAGG